MLAKLIVWGEDRNESIQKMDSLLQDYILLGIRHNLDFLRFFLQTKIFKSGKYHTHSVAALLPDYQKERAALIQKVQPLIAQLPTKSTLPSPSISKISSSLNLALGGFQGASDATSLVNLLM